MQNSESRINEKPKGLQCPKCGCGDFRLDNGLPGDTPHRPWDTVKTIQGKNYVIRYKICRYCGHRIRTKEVIEK